MPLRFILYQIICVIAGAFVACDSPAARLCDIDNIIETDPAEAYEALDTMSLNGFDATDSAYYALLYTQARIKCKLPVESDSLISKAYRHYIHSSNENLRMRVAFYKAQVAYDHGELSAAMKEVLIAYEIAKGNRDAYWTAKTAEVIGDIYFDSYNYWQAEKYTAEAARCYLAAGKILNHRYALTYLGITYFNADKYYQSMNILDSVQLVIEREEYTDSALLNYINRAKYDCLAILKRVDEIDNPYSLPPSNSNSVLLSQYLSLSDIYATANNLEAAQTLLFYTYGLSSNIQEKARIMYADFQLAQSMGDFKRATQLGDSLLFLQGEITSSLSKDAVSGVERDFYEDRADVQIQRNRAKDIILYIIIIASICIILLIIGIYRFRLRLSQHLALLWILNLCMTYIILRIKD